MTKWQYYRKGYLHIRLISKEPERFLNLCAQHHIMIWNLVHIKEYYEMNITISGFYQIKELRKKTSSNIQIKGKHGLPFFFYKNKKRKAFFIGIFLCMGLLYGMSCFIWNIHVEGNIGNSTQSILNFLEEMDVQHGMSKRKVDCNQLAAAIRKEFPSIIWVSTKIKGTKLMVEIQENTDTYEKKEIKVRPQDIIADKTGIIVSIITRAGIPKVKQGQLCQKGDTLVLGRLDITNDNGDVIRHKYVSADADIKMKSIYYYYQEFSLQEVKRIYTGQKKEYHFFRVLDYYLSFQRKTGFSYYHRVSKTNRVQLTENFFLPITYGSCTDYEYENKVKLLEKEEAMQKSKDTLEKFLNKLVEKGIQICENRVRIEVQESKCISKGTIVVLEEAGISAPTTYLASPKTEEKEEKEEKEEEAYDHYH